ncbi:microtubule nucleation factor SSNA1 [Carassius auratus]|uniref:Microtubule nucleation factor SSNA1 n=1 Tax=Carassius auratus TaxID=7957 RepID=A0A6P6K7G2_CARAU|nr:Sjoegren syndrome nuclear autoantigen 1-like [Carassius auratus]XP_052412816.1 microtubule nucleation factor SSNA1-like [Carassius gibelio]XP_052413651.1 microtubule nucleation factor SSNA1-like [Carassius gibelio]XP_052413897.1 Sjoegren syndrome nuclear autoantigen 1 [Carassius gibelio]XP_052475024.1 microtubule nucleation factor SSNA1-like [Carassius gibelio]
MTQQGAALQTYNNELVKCIEELCSKREDLNRLIQQEEAEKSRLQHDIRVLTEKLSRVNESLARRLAARADFDRTIAETEAAYMKILESSQTLLSVLKKETGNLTKATEPRSSKDH